MQTTEEQMHLLLDELAPNVHTNNEQAKIIAFASSIYYKNFASKRIARKIDIREAEAHMTDAILQAMGQLNNWHDEYENNEYFESQGLTNKQIINRISQKEPKWGKMDILDPDVLSYLDFDEDDKDFSEQKLENGVQEYDILQTEGQPHHRSDSLSKPC
jgi:hypothetical protein